MLELGRAEASAIINAPIEHVNVSEWMFTLTSEEYAACSKDHQSAAQGRLPSGTRFSVNVERADSLLVVQHYIETVSERHRVVAFSPNSVFWMNDTDYAFAQVTWEVAVEKDDEEHCVLTCSAFSESDNEAFVTKLHSALKEFAAEKSPLQLHMEEETPLFAKDIERKALAGIWM